MSVPSPSHYLVTGLSGAGLTLTLAHFAKLGFGTDSPSTLSALSNHLETHDAAQSPLALMPENPALLGPGLRPAWADTLTRLQRRGVCKILQLHAPASLLKARFEARQKKHALQVSDPSLSLAEAISAEAAVWESLALAPDYRIDTGNLSPEELYNKIARIVGAPLLDLPLQITVCSFGYQYGIVPDADMMVDMRFLPNPFYLQALRPLTGLDAAIGEYLEAQPVFQSFKQYFLPLVRVTLQGFKDQGRSRVMLALGCTGGKHRSVYTAELLAKYLRGEFPGATIDLAHRENARWAHIAGGAPLAARHGE